MLTWAQPIWLIAAGAAVAVPLIAHLLSQKGGIPVVFPTIRFLKQVVDEGRRRVRLRHWLLLLLRCLAVALLAAAFASPTWTSTFAIQSPAGGQGIDARILLDRSASMSRMQDGRTLFEIARERTLAALRTLDPSRDVATVILLDNQPRSLLPEPTANLSQLIRLVEALEPGYEHGDASAALRLLTADHARSSTQDSGLRTQDRQRRLLLFTDLQASQWPNAASIRSALPPDTNVSIDQLGAPADNLALHRPTIAPTRPVTGQPVTVRVELSRWSDGSPAPQAVTLRLRHESRTQVQVIRMPGNTTATASFTIVPTKAGSNAIELSADSESIDDPLAADDSAGLFIDVAASRRVAVVSSADTNDSSTATFYVMRALSPQADDEGNAPRASVITAVRWSANEIASRLSDAASRDAADEVEFIILSEAGSIGDEELAALRRYIAGGGGVLWLIDSADAAESWKRWEAMLDPKRGESVQAARWLTNADEPLGAGRFSDPTLEVFTGASRSELLSTRFKSLLRMQRPADQSLLSFEDGSAALWASWLGAGRVAVFAADIAPASSDLVKGSQFAPLLHQLVHHLSPGPPAPPAARPGEPVRIALPREIDTANLVGRAPDGRALAVTWESSAGRRVALLPAADEPGTYQLIRAGGGTSSPVGGATVAIDPDESDLRTSRDSVAAPVNAGAAAEGAASATLRPQTTELWAYFIAAAALLLILESLVVSLNPAWFARFTSRASSAGGVA